MTDQNTLTQFLVFAVPRSGTTLMARVFNEHPHVLCGSERFNADQISPQHLTVEGFKTLDLHRARQKATAESFEAKKDLQGLVCGDKAPRAYFHLDTIVDRFEQEGKRLKLICILRDIRDVEASWHKRAVNPKDAGWHSGQHSVFPFIEFLILIKRLTQIARPEDCLVLPYHDWVTPDRQQATVDAIASVLELSDGSPMLDALISERVMTRRLVNKADTERQSDFSTQTGFFDQVVNLSREAGPTRLSKLQNAFDLEVSELVSDGRFFDDVLQFLNETSDPEVREYRTVIIRHYFSSLALIDHAFSNELQQQLETWNETVRYFVL